MTLPLFITRNNRIWMAFACGFAFFFGYSIPNHYHLFAPQPLVLTEWDKAIPLMPWTIFVYTSEYWLFISAYFVFEDELNRNRYIWSYFGVLFIGAIAFTLFPTTYPRADYPLPIDIPQFTYTVFAALRTADDPSNCFPSMHVSCCFLTAFAFLPKTEARWKFWLYMAWSTLVALSTLSTKQHYIADVVSGIVLSIAGYWFFFKKVRYIPLDECIKRISREFI